MYSGSPSSFATLGFNSGTSDDGPSGTSRGDLVCVFSVIFRHDNDGDALVIDVGNLQDACQRERCRSTYQGECAPPSQGHR